MKRNEQREQAFQDDFDWLILSVGRLVSEQRKNNLEPRCGLVETLESLLQGAEKKASEMAFETLKKRELFPT